MHKIFTNFPTRDDLEAYLEKIALTKQDLLHIARLLKVMVRKTDDTQIIADKFVDATIGYRIRSETIRGR